MNNLQGYLAAIPAEKCFEYFFCRGCDTCPAKTYCYAQPEGTCCRENFLAWANGAAVKAAELLPNGWIGVKERLPKPFVTVLACRKGGKVEAGMLDINGWWKIYGTRTKNVTHRMPLPEPPEKRSADGLD